MKTPKIPNNSLTEEITEIVSLCEELESEYGEDASWFSPPTSEEEIVNWENENNVSIPESYKEWLRFSDEATILNTLAHFYGPQKFRTNFNDMPDDLVEIGNLLGDGQRLCFSKSTGNIIRYDHGHIREYDNLAPVLNQLLDTI